MSDDDLIQFLRAAAPNAYCLRCLSQAFRTIGDVRRRVEEAMMRGEPVEIAQGRCTICADQRSVVRHETP